MAGQELGERQKEQREREKESRGRGGWARVRRERKKVESRGMKELLRVFWKMVYGKFFCKTIFPFFFFFFHEGFFDQLQIIYVDFSFTAKQTLTNDKNVLRKMFYVKTNGT